MSEPPPRLDGIAQAALLRSGAVSPRELVEAAIGAVEAVNPQLNAVIHPRFERARAEAAALRPEDLADRPLAGVPVLVKDLDGTTAGDPYHAGSEHLRRAGYVATVDSWLQARLRAAGMIVLGRTNTPELGLIPTTEPKAHGVTRNPWDPARSPGGSSGGSAAAVAAGMVAIAHAGDGGGSIRIPAAHCGLVGLMPSRGRTSLGPHHGEAWGGFVRRHVVTRTVRDTAAVLDAVHGWQLGDPYTAPPPDHPFAAEVGAATGRLRIGVLRRTPEGAAVHRECEAAVAGAAALLAELGHEVADDVPWVLPEAEHAALSAHFTTAFLVFAAADVAGLERLSGVPVTPETVEPTTWALAEAGRAVSAADHVAAMEGLGRATRRVAAWWETADLLVTPTVPEPPPVLGSFGTDGDDPWMPLGRSAETVAFTAPFNATGQPAVSLPLHWTAEGLPVGVQLVAAYGREDLLLRVAAQLEQARPWADRRPPVHA